MIDVRPVTIDNWREISRLKVREDQLQFVSLNLQSIAEAQFGFKDKPGLGHWNASSFGVYDGHEPVGYMMLAYNFLNPEKQGYIVRLMLDEKFQGMGFGKQAMEWTINHFRTYEQIHAIAINYKPGNYIARKLYAAFGFQETGEIDEGEVVAVLRLPG